MRIRTKLLIGTSALVAVAAVIGSVSLIAESRTTAAKGKLGEMATDLSVSAETSSDLLMVRMSVKDFLLSNSNADRLTYDARAATFRDSIDEMTEVLQNPRRAELIGLVADQFEAYDTAFNAVLAV
ncbi:MAG: hypothetical protein AAF085_13045, partial [Planctomycetota bacterium]